MNWTCPYCNHKAIIRDQEKVSKEIPFRPNKEAGWQYVNVYIVYCPNEACNKFTLALGLWAGAVQNNAVISVGEPKNIWHLLPESEAKPLPDYIPDAIAEDYGEACLIKAKSPKASATLARRCLQGMIRDFWGISKARLIDEIQALKEKVDADTWDAIDSVRKIGNIGAHMEKDINVIVDVDPEEAGLLIELIETLIEEWYIARHNRKERMAKVKEVAAQKEHDKAAGGTSPKTET